MTTSLKSQDDRLHSPGSAANWRESYYFNFHDAAGRAGLTYISMSPHQRKVERIIMVLMPEEGKTLVRIQQDTLADFKDVALEEGVLQYHCLEPLQRWQLQAEADCLSIPSDQDISSVLATARTESPPVERVPVAFDLRFEAGMPAYRFPDGAWDFLGQGQEHFEQAGQISGWLRIGDEETPLAGLGGRDRSWGVRDWLGSEWYNWINLQFREEFFIGAVLSRAEGQEASCGFVHQGGRLQPIVQVVLEAQRDPDDLHLLAGQARIVMEQGHTFDLDLTPLSFLHITPTRDENWQSHGSETLVTCQCGEQTGRGFAEYIRREPISPLVLDKSTYEVFV